MTDEYLVPAAAARETLVVAKSRFIGTAGRADCVEDARAFIQKVRSEMPDASHHVYAFRIGYESSFNEGMSDDGEPSGTAGPPVLAVVRGADIGDIVLVVTRYFGGTKLGTGGLVRAYSETARMTLSRLQTMPKVSKCLLFFDLPYPLYERVVRLVSAHGAVIVKERFAEQISLSVEVREKDIEALTAAIAELSAGNVRPIRLA
ncbi:MAG: YigZ family protein [Aggregatilineales bacterium]